VRRGSTDKGKNMQDATTVLAQKRKPGLPLREIRMLLAATIGLPAVARAFQLLDFMPTEIALYWMIAPLFFTIWVLSAIGRNVWLELGGWAALTTTSFYVLESSLALA
jgi:hypothetical protein